MTTANMVRENMASRLDLHKRIESELNAAISSVRGDPIGAERALRHVRRRALRLGFSDLDASALHWQHMMAGLAGDNAKILRTARKLARERPTYMSLLATLLEVRHRYRDASEAYSAVLARVAPGTREYVSASEGFQRVQKRLQYRLVAKRSSRDK